MILRTLLRSSADVWCSKTGTHLCSLCPNERGGGVVPGAYVLRVLHEATSFHGTCSTCPPLKTAERATSYEQDPRLQPRFPRTNYSRGYSRSTP